MSFKQLLTQCELEAELEKVLDEVGSFREQENLQIVYISPDVDNLTDEENIEEDAIFGREDVPTEMAGTFEIENVEDQYDESDDEPLAAKIARMKNCVVTFEPSWTRGNCTFLKLPVSGEEQNTKNLCGQIEEPKPSNGIDKSITSCVEESCSESLSKIFAVQKCVNVRCYSNVINYENLHSNKNIFPSPNKEQDESSDIIRKLSFMKSAQSTTITAGSTSDEPKKRIVSLKIATLRNKLNRIGRLQRLWTKQSVVRFHLLTYVELILTIYVATLEMARKKASELLSSEDEEHKRHGQQNIVYSSKYKHSDDKSSSSHQSESTVK
ncbi:hypothetical protein FQA39_LY04501 [Lamprigera yunnana]|nr:hypothetical protein FQA39_LY04501 [Lamprigera yunnana]